MAKGVAIKLPAKCKCGFSAPERWRMARHFAGKPKSCNIFKGTNTSAASRQAKSRANSAKVAGGTSVLVLQNDDRQEWYIPALRYLNRLWAQSMGYDYKFVSTALYGSKPPWWRKIFLVRDHLQHYQSVVYLDSDAVWHDADVPVERLKDTCGFNRWLTGLYIGTGTSFFKSYDANCGVFVVHGARGRTLVDQWFALYTNGVASGWSVTLGPRGAMNWQWSSGGWAGPLFEQGAFAESLAGSTGIYEVSLGVLDSVCVSQRSGCLAKHFMGPHKCNIKGYLLKYHPDAYKLLGKKN